MLYATLPNLYNFQTIQIYYKIQIINKNYLQVDVVFGVLGSFGCLSPEKL